MKETPNDIVLLNDFKRFWSDVGTEATARFQKIGESGWYILGTGVENFEKYLAKFSRTQHAIGCGNGLDALEISLRTLGLNPGDLVLTTPLSAFATSLAIVRAGGTPAFVDVDSNGLVDLDSASQALSSHPEIRFFVPVHLYGHPLDLHKLKKLKEKFGLKIVEDCAQAIGAKFDGIPVGTIGQMAGLSFYPTKNLGCMGDGGAILTRDLELASKARTIRDYGQSSKYIHDEIGLNSRLDEVHAEVLEMLLRTRLEKYTSRRSEIAKRYHAGISNPNIGLMKLAKEAESVWHLFPILFRDADARQNFIAFATDSGVQTGIHYPRLISEQTALDGRKEILSSLGMAEKFARTVLSIPISPFLKDAEVDRVIDVCNRWNRPRK